MKVILFCGGLGTRMREYSQRLPKPLADIRQRPILWYVMKYYAYFGHRDFILCTGYKADVMNAYFEHHKAGANTPFVLEDVGREILLYGEEIANWNVTCVDTGLHSTIGERLRRVQPYVANEARFLANYSDGVTDLHLPDLLDFAEQHDKTGTFVAVRPNHSFHTVRMDQEGSVAGIVDLRESGVLINGGYFVFKQAIFDMIQPDEELIVEPFSRLIAQRQLQAYQHNGYWACMDTFKDKAQLEKMLDNGEATWQVWERLALPRAA
jgi:glucose-1-phosphate cytidylyltransferase